MLVTGGAGGIDRLIAEKSLKLGAWNVVIWDIDKEVITRFDKSFDKPESRFHFYRVDLSRPEEIKNAAEMTLMDMFTGRSDRRSTNG